MPKGGFNAKLRLLTTHQPNKPRRNENDNQDESLQLRSLPGSLLQLRLPERQGEKPSRRLRVRRDLQVRPNVLLQEVLSADRTPRILPMCGVSEGHQRGYRANELMLGSGHS